MTQVLNLEIPEEIYPTLLEIARSRGQSPEEFALQWLMVSIQHFQEDPLEPLIGSIQSKIPDWTENSDRYLGENLYFQKTNLLENR